METCLSESNCWHVLPVQSLIDNLIGNLAWHIVNLRKSTLMKVSCWRRETHHSCWYIWSRCVGTTVIFNLVRGMVRKVNPVLPVLPPPYDGS